MLWAIWGNDERMMSHTEPLWWNSEIIIPSVKMIIFEDSGMNFTGYRCVACTPSVFSISLSPISSMLPESFKWVNNEVNVFSIVIVNIIYLYSMSCTPISPFKKKKKKKQYGEEWISKMQVRRQERQLTRARALRHLLAIVLGVLSNVIKFGKMLLLQNNDKVLSLNM